MKTKIVFVTHSIGSTNIAIEIIKNISTNFEIYVFYTPYSKKYFKSFNKYINYIECRKNISKKKIREILTFINPSFAFIGAGGDNMFEFNFLIVCNNLKLHTCSIIDSWSYPFKRFRRIINNKTITIVPKIIGVPNKETKENLKRNLKNKKILIYITGLPHLYSKAATLLNFIKNTNYQKNILFISTPMEISKKYQVLDKNQIIFDSSKILKIFIKQAINLIRIKKIKTNIYICLHPLDSILNYAFLNKLKSTSLLKITVMKNNKNIKNISNIDAVFGITSTMLLEFIYANINTYSLQIGRGFSRKNNYFSNIKNLNVINSKEKLNKTLINILENKKITIKKDKYEKTEKIISKKLVNFKILVNKIISRNMNSIKKNEF